LHNLETVRDVLVLESLKDVQLVVKHVQTVGEVTVSREETLLL
jgi:hypothetical protein